MLGLGLCALVTACDASEGRGGSVFERTQDDELRAGAIVVSPEMMDLVVTWSTQDAQEGGSFYEFLDEARVASPRDATLPSHDASPGLVEDIEQLEDAVAQAQQESQQEAQEDASPDAEPSTVSCVTVLTEPEISHMPSSYESWNETEEVKPGSPDRGHLNYWGSRQGATHHSRFFLWGKHLGAEFERADRESNYVRVVVQNLCLDEEGNRVDGGEDATLHLHGSYNARFYTHNYVGGIWSKASYAQAQAWAFFGYADNDADGQAELTPLFDKSLEVKRFTKSTWSKQALHDLLEFGIDFGLGAATSGWSTALSDLDESDTASDIADLFTATYIERSGESNGSDTDVMRVDAGELHSIPLQANVPKVIVLHQTFGHYGRVYGGTTESVSEITTDYAVLGMVERAGEGKPVGFYAFGSHDEFEPERTLESIRAFAPTWFILAGWPSEDSEANGALDVLRQPISSGAVTRSGVLVY
ncbi:MAG: hypothetical protein KDK70_08370 [Myxococcales bacterium]|nr:hypothetical protein [Myxococcales bacterium]